MTARPPGAPDDPGRELRDRFSVAEVLNTVCHDVRATLSVTAGSATELGAPDYGPLTDMQRQLVAIIQRGNVRLARLAGNLMALAELWDGTLEVHAAPTDVVALVRQTADDLRKQDSGSRVQLELAAAPASATVAVDPDQFRQVLSNLLGLAFSLARSRVAVTITDAGDSVELAVEDDGPERKRTQPSSAIKRVSSTELALAVCEGLLRAHGGSLEVASPLGAAGGCRTVARIPRSGPA